MSNTLINLSKRVEEVFASGARAGEAGPRRAIWPSEIMVLMCLADDVFEQDGTGVTRHAGTKWLCALTKLSESAVRKAYQTLQMAGHIQRLSKPNGLKSATLVHPVVGSLIGRSPVMATAVEAPTHVMITGVYAPDPCNDYMGTHVMITGVPPKNPCNDYMGPSKKEQSLTGTHSAPASADASAREGSPGWDDVDLVYQGWDAQLEAAGQPGPVHRNRARDAAIRRKIREVGLWRVLEIVKRAIEVNAKKSLGQSNFLTGFDFVFEVGKNFAKHNMFARLLDGGREFGPPIPLIEPPAISTAPIADDPADLPLELAELRQRLRAEAGASSFGTWLKPLRFSWDAAGRLVGVAPSHFLADWVTSNYVPVIERLASEIAGRKVRFHATVESSAARVLATANAGRDGDR